MAISQDSRLLSLHLEGTFLSNGHSRVTRKQRITLAGKKLVMRSYRARRISLKRPRRLEASRRSNNKAVERRVKVLKSLIPNTESMGVDGLFDETVEYIMAMQRRVEVMRVLVMALTGSIDG